MENRLNLSHLRLTWIEFWSRKVKVWQGKYTFSCLVGFSEKFSKSSQSHSTRLHVNVLFLIDPEINPWLPASPCTVLFHVEAYFVSVQADYQCTMYRFIFKFKAPHNQVTFINGRFLFHIGHITDHHHLSYHLGLAVRGEVGKFL